MITSKVSHYSIIVGFREYCQWESFNATCGPDEVIAMRTAEYGRMELGRCLLQSYGFVGCRKDVLSYVDSKCSGRHRCSFSIPNSDLDKVQPCPGDLKAYLRAGYTCLKGKLRCRAITCITQSLSCQRKYQVTRLSSVEPSFK